jgi:hypothetical protein
MFSSKGQFCQIIIEIVHKKRHLVLDQVAEIKKKRELSPRRTQLKVMFMGSLGLDLLSGGRK